MNAIEVKFNTGRATNISDRSEFLISGGHFIDGIAVGRDDFNNAHRAVFGGRGHTDTYDVDLKPLITARSG